MFFHSNKREVLRMQTRFTPPTIADDHINLTRCAIEPAPGAPSISPEILCIIEAEEKRYSILRHEFDTDPEQEYTHGGDVT